MLLDRTRGVFLAVLLVGVLPQPSAAAFIAFTDCLKPNIAESRDPVQLHWNSIRVSATFNTSAPSHNLNVTIYGNVTGQATVEKLPPPDDPQWTNPNGTLGKILDLSPSNNKYATLFTTFNVLNYAPYSPPPSRFCNSTLLTTCPIAPVFNFTDGTDPAQLRAFSVANDMYASYAFTTITVRTHVTSGDASAAELCCVLASITPALGSTVDNLITYLPLVVLVLVGIATASAAVFSPGAATDIFRWTSNYGRDADQLRLITPGFGDCLQYLQFVVLSGSLSLDYPGFFQPVVSRVGWSALMFNQSFVSHGSGFKSVVDGIYVVNATYGMDQMSQLIGTSSDEDLWAGTVIWILVIIAALVVVIQLGFVIRWIYRQISHTQEEDHRAKNIPFTIGNIVRIIFNYFLLPIVSLSMYQLIITGHSPSYTVALASITLVALVGFAGWLLWLIASTRPRSYLFDDLPTVLLYGPLYNTYSDNAATFALVPVMLTLLRGIAIGAVQASGVAQLVLLAICEVILILMLNAFRPFSSPTSMNAFHTFFAVVRLLTILLMTAFVESLNVDDAARGWIGYVILLMHAITFFVGFFLHSLQTLTEVIARLAGAGGEDGGTTMGGLVKVFGVRQLSRRNPRASGRARHSRASDMGILIQDNDHKSTQLGGDDRSRSMSASSAILLHRYTLSDGRKSMGQESTSGRGGGHSHTGSGGVPYTPTTLDAASSHGGIVNLKAAESADPYYRPPRPRRVTMDISTPGTRSRGSWGSGDWAKGWGPHSPDINGSSDPGEGPSNSGQGTPVAAHLGGARDRTDSNASERRPPTNYAIREVDYYYGVRGPALSHMPTRRLKTGPADPTGPVSSATGWFKGLFGGKTKETGKGFEVVRSSRMPPSMRTPPDENVTADQTPYKDEPDQEASGKAPERLRDFELDDEGDAVGGGTRHLPEDHSARRLIDDDDDAFELEDDGLHAPPSSKLSPFPPYLPDLDTGDGFQVPSRLPSKASAKSPGPNSSSTQPIALSAPPPKVPRKSSRRTPSYDAKANNEFPFIEPPARLSVVAPSPPSTPARHPIGSPLPSWPLPSQPGSQRLPFGIDPSPSSRLQDPTHSGAGSVASAQSSKSGEYEDAVAGGGHGRHSSSGGGGGSFDGAGGGEEVNSSVVGYVQQHRASDQIHLVRSTEHAHAGAVAELVDDGGLIGEGRSSL